MTYCLMTEDGKVRVEIRCSYANRPDDVGELVLGVREGRIQMVKPQNLPKRIDEKGSACDGRELCTDWTATGIGGRFINWIAIENL